MTIKLYGITLIREGGTNNGKKERWNTNDPELRWRGNFNDT